MTNEERDQAIAEEAWRQTEFGEDAALTAARLAREGWTPPAAVDPDLDLAEKLAADLIRELGTYWRRPAVPHFLQALKQGRALAAAEAKPGMVWVEHDGSGKWPIDPNALVVVRYPNPGPRSPVFAGRADSREWLHVTHYAEITMPEDVA